MSEISIKIKAPISKVRTTKTKKKAKARTTKPKSKTENYLEKLKGREYSYNISPFYDYKSSLEPTYIYRQQTIPQLQQDSKHNELIKYLEHMKKTDRELQTGKFRHTDPPVPHFPEHLLNQPKQEPKQEEEDEDEDEEEPKITSGLKVDEVVEVKEVDRYHKLEKEIEKKKKKIKTEETKYNNAIDREIQRAKENKPLVYESKQEKSSNEFLKGINILKTEIAEKELEKNILKRNLGIK